MFKRVIQLAIIICTMGLCVGSSIAQSGVRAFVVNEFANIRLVPAIGADVIDTVEAGYLFETVEARDSTGEWIRVQYAGQQGWVNLVPLQVLEGDPNALPIADPRSQVFGGAIGAPKAGFSDQQGAVTARATNGLRVRGGPSTAYPTLDNINYNEGFTITGRYGCCWYQVNYDGTLGWVSSRFVAILDGDINSVPVNGITAQSTIPSSEGAQDYFNVLRLMLDRVNLAQPSLNTIREYWTDAALTGRAACSAYPTPPSDFPISQPLLAAYYGTLKPLQDDFNDAVFNIRQAIDLFRQVCNQPGTGNPVGQATVQGALNTVETAQTQFDSLRQRLNELIPDDRAPGPDECLLQFNGKAEIIPVIKYDTIYLDEVTRRQRAHAYCINAVEGTRLNIQALPLPPGELALFIALSPIDNPTDFVVVNQNNVGGSDVLTPIELDRTTQYVLLIADLGGEDRLGIGEYAFRVTNTTFLANEPPLLGYDPDTDSVILTENPFQYNFGEQPTPDTPEGTCPSTAFTCDQLFSCEEAQACYNAGNFNLDTDGDGIPCEQTLCTPDQIQQTQP